MTSELSGAPRSSDSAVAAAERSYALTPVQHGMLFHHLQDRHGGVDIEQMVIRFREAVDGERLRAAWQTVTDHHPALRTSFRWQGLAEPMQDVHARVDMRWTEQDWSGAADGEAKLTEFLAADRASGFDFAKPPLQRFALVRLGPTDTRFVWTFSHAIVDGNAFAAVVREAFELYDAQRGALAGDPVAFSDYVAWLTAHIATQRDAARAFWRAELAGAEKTPLPSAFAPVHARGEVDVALSRDTTAALRATGVSLSTMLHAAWAFVLSRHAGTRDVIVGTTRAGRRDTIDGAERIVGACINTVPLRVMVPGDGTIGEWVSDVRRRLDRIRPFEHTPLVDVQTATGLSPAFENLIVFNLARVGTQLGWTEREVTFIEQTDTPLTLFGYAEDPLLLKLSYDASRVDGAVAARMASHVGEVLDTMAAGLGAGMDTLPPIVSDDAFAWHAFNATAAPVEPRCVHDLFAEQVARTPDVVALVFGERTLTYAQLGARANVLASELRRHGVGRNVPVGIFLERSLETVIAQLAILEAGGAYFPLDPSYPPVRLAMMVEDAGPPVIVTSADMIGRLPAHAARVVDVSVADSERGKSRDDSTLAGLRGADAGARAQPDDLAYVIFTSGSTGRPKGVMVEHRNVTNFFAGMDRRLGTKPGVWLAVTSISFDISVLELLWTLCRGYTVVVQPEAHRLAMAGQAGQAGQTGAGSHRAGGMAFSLFYFAADAAGSENEKYKLLIEGAKFADSHGFSAVWTPERHFHAFGGLYPNPSVTSAALAMVTKNVSLRAGSVVLPLHSPLRVAEEWSVVDNLSGGRVGLSFASGWHANDFALAPERYADRKRHMAEGIETVRKLWRGEAVPATSGSGETISVRVLPRPIQAEPPLWLTAATSVDSFKLAGELGANVLTNLLGQRVEDLAAKIAAYRESRRAHGFAGPGTVSLMLHTFIGDDAARVRETVRGPFTQYLRTSTDLIQQARWEFPAFASTGEGPPRELTEDEMQVLHDHAFERYFSTSGLFGTVEQGLAMVERLQAIGVTELACLIDFGVPTEVVLENLQHLDRLRQACSAGPATAAPVGEELVRHRATHLQCTPSLARVIPPAALADLEAMLVGGEALPPDLVGALRGGLRGRLLNMYGPTETTVWSSCAEIGGPGEPVTLGTPLANQTLRVVDDRGQPAPIGALGEIVISGLGVTRGYFGRDDLTNERFVMIGGERSYRSGDLGRLRPNGSLEFAGRLDAQVKVRGYRIELGEIEAALLAESAVAAAAAIVREDVPGDKRIVAYVVPRSGGSDAWQTVWNETYAAGETRDDALDLSGWKSSFTGEMIPEVEMQEWVDLTVARIRSLLPAGGKARLLEIGSGTGLLLFRLAPHVDRYEAVDFSPAAVARVRAGVERRGWLNVSVEVSPASSLQHVPSASQHIVVINSVAQYFPSLEYFLAVVGEAERVLVPGGSLFIGDVRSLPLAADFHLRVARHVAPTASDADLRALAKEREGHDTELVFAAELFEHLPAFDASVLSKTGQYDNEMMRYRFDVVLTKRGTPRRESAVDLRQWVNTPARTVSDLGDRLRDVLRDRLPDYMVPSTIVELDAMPLTPNGKIDRRALPAPAVRQVDSVSAVATAYQAPGDDIEQTLVSIWESILRVDRVGTTTNFFDLGGNSLLMVQAHERIRTAVGADVGLVDLFRFPTIGALAAHLRQRGGDQPVLASAQRGEARREALAARRGRGR